MNRLSVISMILITQCVISSSYAISFKASYDPKRNRINANWVKDDKTSRQFVVQRSNDEYTWTDLAYQPVTDFNSRQVFQFLDEHPARGKYYYRLKIIHSNEAHTYSAVVAVNVEPYTYDWLIYPVPVGEIFSIQYKGTAPLLGVVNVQILNMQGKTLTSLRFASTTTTMQIHTNNLFKGLYVLRVIVEDALIWTKQFTK